MACDGDINELRILGAMAWAMVLAGCAFSVKLFVDRFRKAWREARKDMQRLRAERFRRERW